MRHLEAADLDALVSMPDAISAVRAALVDGASFEQPPRLVLDDGRLLVMAATHVPSRRSVVKVVTIREGRQPTIAGTVQWVDDGPGLTADAAHVTSLRTGAACGLATDLLAAPDASVLALIGAGAQAVTQLRAVAAVRSLEHVRVFSRASSAAFVQAAQAAHPGLEIVAVASAAEAVRGAHVISCATTATEPVFDHADLGPEVHINAVGSYQPHMREVPVETMLNASVIVVDDPVGARREAGEIGDALGAGLPEARLVPLGSLAREPRTRVGVTVYKSVGCALLDWALCSAAGNGIAG